MHAWIMHTRPLYTDVRDISPTLFYSRSFHSLSCYPTQPPFLALLVLVLTTTYLDGHGLFTLRLRPFVLRTLFSCFPIRLRAYVHPLVRSWAADGSLKGYTPDGHTCDCFPHFPLSWCVQMVVRLHFPSRSLLCYLSVVMPP